ncbi:hypothetical protein SASPL_147635 [Salvia splendens]|uniref:Uncharacterized protein n=1 Tax=Salvia splendens TaxID=180675 RepID=A0A8X8WFH5_SALSN|nr:hypothetical protein SASPL_147635 [Salvia splendens]
MATISLHSSYNLRATKTALNTCTVQQPRAALSRLHMLLHASVQVLPWGLIALAELIFAAVWTLSKAFRLRPVARAAAPENLPGDGSLPGVDVFVCTADPKKEPVAEVMNTVVSAKAMDYAAEKLAVYLSDDGGAAATRYAIKEACRFAESWCRFVGCMGSRRGALRRFSRLLVKTRGKLWRAMSLMLNWIKSR